MKLPNRTTSVRQRDRLRWEFDTMPDEIRHVLILIYSGCRTSEYINIRKSDIKLRRRVFRVTASKTEAGRNCLVPIPHKLPPYWEALHRPGDFLCRRAGGSQHTYDSFRRLVFDKVMAHFQFKHTPHETRHTLASMLDSADVNHTHEQVKSTLSLRTCASFSVLFLCLQVRFRHRPSLLDSRLFQRPPCRVFASGCSPGSAYYGSGFCRQAFSGKRCTSYAFCSPSNAFWYVARALSFSDLSSATVSSSPSAIAATISLLISCTRAV